MRTPELYVGLEYYRHRSFVTWRPMCERAPTAHWAGETAESHLEGYRWCRRQRTKRVGPVGCALAGWRRQIRTRYGPRKR